MEQRVSFLNDRPVNPRGRCVIYWMERAQRARDNLALIHALEQANALRRPLVCYFGVEESLPMGSPRVFAFMLAGVKEAAAELEKQRIPFIARIESPAEGIVRLEMELDPCLVVVEEAVVGHGRALRQRAAARLSVPLVAIDSEPVVPLRAWGGEIRSVAEMKRRAAPLWRRFLKEPPPWRVKVSGWRLRVPKRMELASTEVESLARSLRAAENVPPSPLFAGGARAAQARLQDFLRKHLADYAAAGEQPCLEATSGLSPYLHFGQIWAGRIALEVKKAKAPLAAKKAFLERLLVERELGMNFCFHHAEHEGPAVTAEWARETLEAHRGDGRSFSYGREQFEAALTHDLLWNAMQRELLSSGRIHPFLRPLWAKCILEWSASPEQAWETAVYLNDKYALDGRDASGYFNIARCLGGVHERPARERAIFGRLPHAATERIKRKIDLPAYLARVRKACRLAGLPEEHR